jgi:uncharacterized protein
MPRTGSAVLPLHYGKIPEWLASRMARLGAVISEAIVQTYGRDELLRRLSHPHWFQSFGAVMGMDWHSSGITTTVLGALKRGLAPMSDELGIYVCGGRGTESRRTPSELALVADRTGLPGDELIRASRLVAKVDGAAVQDGYQIYLHGFIATIDGRWTVVQQGMSEARREARRYHWLSEGLSSFVDSPHTAIDGVPSGEIVNLADRRAEASRSAQLSLIRGGAAPVLRALDKEQTLPLLQLPDHHEVRREDVVMRRLAGALAAAEEAGPRDFEDLLLVKGVGPRTVLSLALAAEMIHGAPCRFTDPARFSLAHGGKDGHPYPVPIKVYDQTIRVLREAVDRSKLGNDDKAFAIERLDREARRLEPHAREPDFDAFIAEEKSHTEEYDGRTVMTHPHVRKRDAKRPVQGGQMSLFGKRAQPSKGRKQNPTT